MNESMLEVPCTCSLSAVPTGALVVPSLAPANDVVFSLVVPTYNERRNIAELIAQVTAAIVSEVGEAYEIIVVDDDSPDRTWEAAAEIAATNPHVRVLRRTDERDLATAVIRGWQVARGQLLGVIDADLQHPPAAVARLLAALRGGADLAVASRAAEGGSTSDWSMVRLLISRSLRTLGMLLLPSALRRVSDPMTGFFIVRRAAVETVALNPCGYKILVELLVRAHIGEIVEVGYTFRSRQNGKSKASLKVLYDYLRHLFRLRVAIREQRRAPAASTPTAIPHR